MQSHRCSTLQVTEFVAAGRSVAVRIEEPSNGLAVLREVGVVETLVPLLIVVNNMVRVWREKFAKLLVGENSIEHPDLVHSGFSTFVSDSGKGR